jgi:flavin reductase (DIM6/NTAB) family NADH-FMN oxidoreductase RutF
MRRGSVQWIKTAFFKLTYGLFLAGVEYDGKWNACIINTAAQATSDPFQMIATMQKSNYTTELILRKESCYFGVLHQNTA